MESANQPECDFPIQNLPLGVFRTRADSRPRPSVAIGDFVLDLRPWLDGERLNSYLALDAADRRELRRTLSKALQRGAPARELVPQADCEMLLPVDIREYTDFYASIHHATNVGQMFRPSNPLLPNYKHVPIAYHGRASSIVVSGTAIERPLGQLGENHFGPTQELDYEIELGAFLGPGNRMGQPIPIGEAEQHIAGVCLLNDWSARDIQRWEYQPLGPFLGKNFATSISPWMVTLEALDPFRTSGPKHDVPTLPYLQTEGDGAFEITLEVWLGSHRVSRASFKDMYWTLAQMVAHHSSNGCPLRAGDLISSGTVSGPEKENCGCLLEFIAKGERRGFLEDGDEVTLKGYCEHPGFPRIGLGICSGVVAYNRKSARTG